MVLVQPHIELVPGRAGYHLPPHLWPVQLRIFRSALDLARQPFTPDVDHSHIVLMPEYGLPSLRFEQCEQLVDELLLPNSVCIAGFDAMSPERWQELLAGAEGGAGQIAQARSTQHDWVNGAAIWVKDRDGRLHRFLQAKLRPNPQEQKAGCMYRGAEVLYMAAGARTFCILLCYDLIARLDRGDVATWLWQQVKYRVDYEQESRPVYLFVLQENERPEHTSFVDSARVLLTTQDPRFEAVFFVNRAGRSGQSCLYAAKSNWPPNGPRTALDDVPRLYRRERVGDEQLTRFALRAGEPGIYRFVYEPKSSLALHAGAPREPIDYALLYPISHGQVCGEGMSVHALQYAVAEAIPKAGPRTARPQPLTACEAILARLEEAFEALLTDLGGLPPGRLQEIMDALLHGNDRTNPDFWDDYRELKAIRRMVEALYVLSAGGVHPRISGGLHAHVTADCDDFTLTILAGDPDTCPEYLYGGFLDLCYDGRPHLLLVLEHMDTGPAFKALRIDQQEAKRVGAGGARLPFPFDDGPFGRQPDEERLGAPHFYWYDRRALLKILRCAPDYPSFLRMLVEVFPWRMA
jgi:hypothetical protein